MKACSAYSRLGQAISALIFLWLFTQTCLVAQDMLVPYFSGTVLAEGRPVNWIVEVRLEGEDSSTVAVAHTFGSARFAFRNVSLQYDNRYYLVIREPGFKELRYELQRSSFIIDSYYRQIFSYGGLIVLDLERLPQKPDIDEKQANSPKTVDIQQLKAKIPDKARREYDLALKNTADGNNNIALEHLENAIELAPDYYDALNMLGVQYIKTGQYDKAETVLERARKLNPNDPIPLTNLGTLYFQKGEGLASAAGGDAKIRMESGKAYYLKAVNVLEEALRLAPGTPRTNFYLGTTLYRVGDYQRAESLLINALAQDSQMQEARLTLVNIYIQNRRYSDALKQIELYLESNPDDTKRKQIENLKIQIESALGK